MNIEEFINFANKFYGSLLKLRDPEFELYKYLLEKYGDKKFTTYDVHGNKPWNNYSRYWVKVLLDHLVEKGFLSVEKRKDEKNLKYYSILNYEELKKYRIIPLDGGDKNE